MTGWTGRISLVLVAGSLIGPGLALAAEAGKEKAPPAKKKPRSTVEKKGEDLPELPPEVAEMLKAGEPGEGHKLLAPLVGNWSFTTKTWEAPGEAPRETTGTSSIRWVLGNRFLQSDLRMRLYGRPYAVLAFTGFDSAKKTYTWLWMNNITTSITVWKGTADPSGKVITFTGEEEIQATGKVKTRIVVRIESEEKHVVETFTGRDGKEVKTTEVTCTRRSPPPRKEIPRPKKETAERS